MSSRAGLPKGGRSDGTRLSSSSPSASKVNGVECRQAAFVQVTNRPSRPWPLRCAIVVGRPADDCKIV